MNVVYGYGLESGWFPRADPLGEWDDFGKALTDEGWEIFDSFGHDGLPFLEIYDKTGSEEFIVSINSPYSWRMVVAEDLPSLLALIGKVRPYADAKMASEVCNMAYDLHDLLTQYGAGPLEEAMLARSLRRERYRQQGNRNKASLKETMDHANRNEDR